MLRTRTRKADHAREVGGVRSAVPEARRDDPKDDQPSSEAVKEITELLDAAALTHESEWPHRQYLKTEIVNHSYSSTEEVVGCTHAEADLISSITMSGEHAPAIDIDMPCRLVPSSTPGHFHLYIEKEMDWKTYEELLKALTRAGIVEDGFLHMAQKYKATHLRVPGKPKIVRKDKTGQPAASY